MPKRELKRDVNMYIWWNVTEDIPKATSQIIFRIDLQDDDMSFTMMDSAEVQKNIPVEIFIFKINDFARKFSTKRNFNPNTVSYQTLDTTEKQKAANEYLFHTESLNYVYTPWDPHARAITMPLTNLADDLKKGVYYRFEIHGLINGNFWYGNNLQI